MINNNNIILRHVVLCARSFFAVVKYVFFADAASPAIIITIRPVGTYIYICISARTSEVFRKLRRKTDLPPYSLVHITSCSNHCRHNTSSFRPSEPKNDAVILFGTVPRAFTIDYIPFNIARGFLQSRVSSEYNNL